MHIEIGLNLLCSVAQSGYKVVVVRVHYLLVLPAVGGEGVVPHLHAEVQPGQGVTHLHPY